MMKPHFKDFYSALKLIYIHCSTQIDLECTYLPLMFDMFTVVT